MRPVARYQNKDRDCVVLISRQAIKEIRYLKWKYIDFEKQTFNAPGRFHVIPFQLRRIRKSIIQRTVMLVVQPIPDH